MPWIDVFDVRHSEEEVVLSFEITKSLISLDPFFMMEMLNRFPFFLKLTVLRDNYWIQRFDPKKVDNTVWDDMTVWLYGVTGIGPCQIEFHSCFLFHLDNRIFTMLIRVCEIWRPIHVKHKDWYMIFVYPQIPTHLFKKLLKWYDLTPPRVS